MDVFHKILNIAVQGGASDVHIKVGTPVIFRINRQLISIEGPIPTEEWVNNVVENAVPKHAKKRLDEDREVDFSYYVPSVGRFRTNVFQQRGQWCLAMRYVKTNVPSFEELGLLPIVKDIAKSPRGIVLVAGSTGSGKSTTLAAMIQFINANFKKHIITLEDPIEFVFEDNQSVIEQREIGLDTLSFREGLKHILRQDPDIIMVGEMRDSISFQAAMSAADTGHLVLSTLHTNDSASAVTRLTEMGIEPFLVSSALDSVLAQRLARKLCERCKEPYVPTEDELLHARFPFDPETEEPPKLYRPVGCTSCGKTGYRGRMAIHEVMTITEEIERATVERKSSDEVARISATQGMAFLRDDGMEKVRQGLTSIEEIMRVIV